MIAYLLNINPWCGMVCDHNDILSVGLGDWKDQSLYQAIVNDLTLAVNSCHDKRRMQHTTFMDSYSTLEKVLTYMGGSRGEKQLGPDP